MSRYRLKPERGWFHHSVQGLSLGLLIAMAGAGAAQAEPTAADKSSAETLFDEGRRLMAENKYEQACPKLADSNRLDPGVGTLLNLGRCYKALGKSASAWSTFREAAAMARSSGQVERESLARSEATSLEPTLIRLVVEVPPEVAAQNPQIYRDGTLLPEGLWGLPAPVDPGTHVVEARAPGKRSARLEFSPVAAGSTVKAVIPLLETDPAASAAVAAASTTAVVSPPPEAPPVAPASVGAAPPPAGPADTGAPAGTAMRTAGFVVGGIGVAAAATGVVFLVLGKKENDAALAQCTGGPDGNVCEDEIELENHDNHVATAKTNFAIGYVGLGVGVAGIATGAVLVALSGNKAATTAGQRARPAFAFAPRLGPGQLGLDLSGRF